MAGDAGERDGVEQVLLADDVGDNGLLGGRAEGARHAVDGGERSTCQGSTTPANVMTASPPAMAMPTASA